MLRSLSLKLLEKLVPQSLTGHKDFHIKQLHSAPGNIYATSGPVVKINDSFPGENSRGLKTAEKSSCVMGQ